MARGFIVILLQTKTRWLYVDGEGKTKWSVDCSNQRKSQSEIEANDGINNSATKTRRDDPGMKNLWK